MNSGNQTGLGCSFILNCVSGWVRVGLVNIAVWEFWSWHIGLALAGYFGFGTGRILGRVGSMYTYMYLLSPFLTYRLFLAILLLPAIVLNRLYYGVSQLLCHMQSSSFRAPSRLALQFGHEELPLLSIIFQNTRVTLDAGLVQKEIKAYT